MVEWLTLIFDSRVFLRMNAAFGFLFLGLYYFSEEGKDERGRGLVAEASLIAFAVLFVLLNVFVYFTEWAMENVVRLSNWLQTVYTLFLLTADVALAVLRKIR